MRVLAPLALALALTACNGAPAAPIAEQAVLRVYDVPPGQARELKSVVSWLLQRGEAGPIGTAGLAPTGQLLVSAPQGFQEGVADLIARVQATPPAAPTTITLDTWVVAAAPADAKSAGASVAPEIAAALDAAQEAQGPMRFALLGRVSASGLSGEVTRAEGNRAQTDHTATVIGSDVVAELKIERTDGFGRFSGRVTLPLGQIVSVAQTGTEMKADDPLADAGKGAQLFYLVRATKRGG